MDPQRFDFDLRLIRAGIGAVSDEQLAQFRKEVTPELDGATGLVMAAAVAGLQEPEDMTSAEWAARMALYIGQIIEAYRQGLVRVGDGKVEIDANRPPE